MPGEMFSLGIPVDIGAVDRKLKKLWKDAEGAMTRASHINLAVYDEQPGSLTRNTQWIARICENHACRAIVIAADPAAKKDRVEAWISAHCHVSQAGSKQVCSEQISILLEGASVKLLSSILFSQLDSDLPVHLWWQAKFVEPMDPQLWACIDRLIYDSQPWSDFNAQMRLVEAAQQRAKQRIVLCDLNWTRLVHFRLACAQFFDHPTSHHHFHEIENVTLQFGRNHRSTAVLFVGWLAAQLRWELVRKAQDGAILLKNARGKTVKAELKETDGSPLACFSARSGKVSFSIAVAPCGDLLEICRHSPAEKSRQQLMPATENDTVKLMTEELMRGGSHKVYLAAVEKMRSVL